MKQLMSPIYNFSLDIITNTNEITNKACLDKSYPIKLIHGANRILCEIQYDEVKNESALFSEHDSVLELESFLRNSLKIGSLQTIFANKMRDELSSKIPDTIVDGEVLKFDDPEQAECYNYLRFESNSPGYSYDKYFFSSDYLSNLKEATNDVPEFKFDRRNWSIFNKIFNPDDKFGVIELRNLNPLIPFGFVESDMVCYVPIIQTSSKDIQRIMSFVESNFDLDPSEYTIEKFSI